MLESAAGEGPRLPPAELPFQIIRLWRLLWGTLWTDHQQTALPLLSHPWTGTGAANNRDGEDGDGGNI